MHIQLNEYAITYALICYEGEFNYALNAIIEVKVANIFMAS